MLSALTIGDKSLISDDFSHNVKTTGISHVVVVSGMHLSIIMSAIFFIVDKLFYNKYLKCGLSILFIILIVIISVLLTVFAGLVPSRMASKKDPVESLRSE